MPIQASIPVNSGSSSNHQTSSPESNELASFYNASNDYGNSNANSDIKKRRVGKACDSCRIKKTKCDGRKPCSKCLADNKICVYSERKRPKDKHYPAGYVELLETRLDLLSKSLEKLINLSCDGVDLRFLQSKGDELFSVNHVISYLINENGLLENQPLEWEKGAAIAANLPDDYSGIHEAARKFAEHSQLMAVSMDSTNNSNEFPSRSNSNSQAFSPVNNASPVNYNRSSVIKEEITQEDLLEGLIQDGPNPDNISAFSRSVTNESIVSNSNLETLRHAPGSHQNIYDLPSNINYDMGLNEYQIPPPSSAYRAQMEQAALFTNNPFNQYKIKNESDLTPQDFELNLGGFSSGAALAAAAIDGGLSMSDFEDNSGYNHFGNSPDSDASTTTSNVPKSLFVDTGVNFNTHTPVARANSAVSLTSLTSHFENQSLNNATSSASNHKKGSSISRPYSPSSAKKLNSGHVAKPLNKHSGLNRSNSINSNNHTLARRSSSSHIVKDLETQLQPDATINANNEDVLDFGLVNSPIEGFNNSDLNNLY